MNSFEDFNRIMQQKLEQIKDIIMEEMKNKAIMCVGEAQGRTPVKTGNLKSSMTHDEIEKNNNIYSVQIGSELKYMPAVEKGHTQTVGRYVPAIGARLKRSFVPGYHMVGDSIEIYQRVLDRSIESRVRNEVFR